MQNSFLRRKAHRLATPYRVETNTGHSDASGKFSCDRLRDAFRELGKKSTWVKYTFYHSPKMTNKLKEQP